ncbi:23S rRNA/tRNA pseudouridine synthase A, partial [Thraustotheca clavata]
MVIKRKHQKEESGNEIVVKEVLALALKDLNLSVDVRLHQLNVKDGFTPITTDIPLRVFHAKSINGSMADVGNALLKAVQMHLSAVHIAGFSIVSVEIDSTGSRLVFYTRQTLPAVLEGVVLDPRIKILYIDDAIAVVDKPANFLSVEGVDHPTSVYSLLKLKYPQVRMVHRLDYETSGILVVALTLEAAQHLNTQFREKTIQKQYHALIHGSLEPTSGNIEIKICPDPNHRVKQMIDENYGKNSLTNYKQLSSHDGTSYVELNPISGRTHQLRIHLYFKGCPIIGDSLYYLDDAEEKSI